MAYARVMPHSAVDERHALAETLREVGPDVATLCGEWTTSRLAAHLVLRERSVHEIGAHVPVPALQRRTERALDELAAASTYDELVDLVARGPVWRDVIGPVPVAWLWSLPAVRETVNLLEYVIHHEDVRRARPDWAPRPLPVSMQQVVWQRLRPVSRLTLRTLPVGVELVWPSHGSLRRGGARRDHGESAVVISGDPLELALLCFGREPVALLDWDGEADAVAAVRDAPIAF